jgi:hypothetical protein
MAKKSFRSGLGSLIQDSSIEFEANGISKENSPPDSLRAKIDQLQDELKLWRTGKLNLEMFVKTLNENQLGYNAETNSFYKLV